MPVGHPPAAGTAWLLAVETKDLLIGEAAAPATVAGVRRLAAGISGVEKVNEVLTLHMGPEYILVNMSLDFDDELPAGQEHFLELNKELSAQWPVITASAPSRATASAAFLPTAASERPSTSKSSIKIGATIMLDGATSRIRATNDSMSAFNASS